MKVLSIETSCEQGSVALLIDGQLHSRRIDGAVNHSANVLRDVRSLLSEAGLTVNQLDAVAFGAGPGAFTGLRLACGVAQGLALGAGIGVAAVCSLQAMALRGAEQRIFVATDARMGEVYCAAFIKAASGIPEQQGPILCCSPQDLVLPAGQWAGVGSAFAAWPALMAERHAEHLISCHPDDVPRAEEVALLGAHLAQCGALVPPEHAAPLYVRDKVALTTAERLARGGKA
jgi:tRNA threonylcarbamoyladenosine biosynthesis protein TsaB